MTEIEKLTAELALAHRMMEQDKEDYDALAARFEAQSREITQLTSALTAAHNRIVDDSQIIDRHVAKIGELQNALIAQGTPL